MKEHFLVYPSMYPALNSHAVRGGAEPTDEFVFCWSDHFIGRSLGHPSLTTADGPTRQSVALTRPSINRRQ